jgi:hypothetical protein
MTIPELQTALMGRNIALFLEGESLRYRSPAGAMTAELRSEITSHREALVRGLKSSPVGRCRRCEMRDWVDEQPKDGRIRTHCGRCGRFIGYRPANLAENGKRVLDVS